MPTALVTGASKGIGAAIARRLAQDGFDVIVHYKGDASGARRTADAVKSFRRTATIVKADLTVGAEVGKLANQAEDVAKRIDCVVHNAGIYERMPFEAMTGAAWVATRLLDLDAPALLTRALLPRMARDSSITFISSIAAFRGSAHGAHYAAAKGALIGLTRSLALELAPKVRVNAVAPGYVDTNMLRDDTPLKRKQRAAEVPLGRIGRPEEVAGAVSYLSGADGRYVTGQVLHVNGGLWMG